MKFSWIFFFSQFHARKRIALPSLPLNLSLDNNSCTLKSTPSRAYQECLCPLPSFFSFLNLLMNKTGSSHSPLSPSWFNETTPVILFQLKMNTLFPLSFSSFSNTCSVTLGIPTTLFQAISPKAILITLQSLLGSYKSSVFLSTK